MFPIEKDILAGYLEEAGIHDITTATIRQIAALSEKLEKEAGEKFVHLELGNPGLPPEEVGMAAERRAICDGVTNRYPNIAGIPELKEAGAKFAKSFLDVEIDKKCVIPTVGSMQGSFTLFLLLSQRDATKDTILFLNPGFPAQWHQAKVLGINAISLDIFNHRGDLLRYELEKILSRGNITAIIYSNPNNPAWTNLTDVELQSIGELATRHDAIVIEDHAYMGMDFRDYYGHPGEAPYVPTVAKYTENYVLLISASKIFSYAGQRIAIACISNSLYNRNYPKLEAFYEMPCFGDCYVFGVLYTASSGATHSAQYAMAAMLNAACEGNLNFVDNCSEYARRGKRVKEILKNSGFHLVYADDAGRPISDGFFFTAGYDGIGSGELQKELLRYGISTIALPCTGSEQNGVRVCVSAINDEPTFQALDQRLKAFDNDHKN